jgi:hypothetical protein
LEDRDMKGRNCHSPGKALSDGILQWWQEFGEEEAWGEGIF